MAKKKEQPMAEIERPPVVAIMGHIDHGKSTLLDYIRKSNVVDGEAGGITQHISAYEVVHETKEGQSKRITFLDTPGHEAFSGMRQRGSAISDIGILIVSAEEGVKAQTIEALKSIQETGIPFLVAINKIDRPNSNPEKIKQELAENNVSVESYGGKIPSVNISAKTGEGIPDLLDIILLLAELEEMKANPGQPASGFVLESNLDPKTGNLITLIIKNGTLKTGDFVVSGKTSAKIKKIEDFKGHQIPEAMFSSPVRVYGFSESPSVGDEFITFKSKKEMEKHLKALASQTAPATGTQNETRASSDEFIEIPIIVKADTAGTKEAVEKEVAKLTGDRVIPKIIQSGTGTITENDLKVAVGATNPIVIGFNVAVAGSARDLAERNNIPIQVFDIIYKLTEWLAEELENRRPVYTVEKSIGKAKILKTFSQSKDKQVLGGQVKEGVLQKGKVVKILRRDEEIGRGKIIEMQQQKLAVAEVAEPNQFGAMIEAKIGIAEGDTVEAFDLVQE